MNAPINTALLQLRAGTEVPAFEQPTVPPDLTRLMCNYLHDDVYLDLHGVADEDDGCSVEAVTLAGHSANIVSLIKPEQLKQMAWAVDRAALRNKAISQEQARAERAVFDRHCHIAGSP